MKVTYILFPILFLSTVLSAQTAKDLTQTGMDFYEKHDYTQALINLNKAIEIDPAFSRAYYVRANIKESFDDRHGAMKDYNLALEKNPKFADAFFARGNVKMKLQDYYGAIDDYTAAIGINESYIEAYFNRGKAKQYLLAYEDAINDCTKIIQINSKNVDAYYMRGILRINFGDVKNGCLDLSKAGELGDLKAYESIKERCNQKTSDIPDTDSGN
jgi:tetratricopeptide (TPR) repeat protein